MKLTKELTLRIIIAKPPFFFGFPTLLELSAFDEGPSVSFSTGIICFFPSLSVITIMVIMK